MRGKKILALALVLMVVAGNSNIVKGSESRNTVDESVLSLQENDVTNDATGVSSNISGNYTYTINSDGKTCTITNYSGTEENVVIPDNINGYTVTVFDQPFNSNAYVKNITVPKTVTTMGTYDSAFAIGSVNLENIYVDNQNPVYYAVDGVLYKRGNGGIILSEYPSGKDLTTFRIPNNVTYIGMGSFVRTKNLQKVIIPNTVVGLHDFSFLENQLEICFSNNENISISGSAIKNMKSGTKIIVPNSSIKDKVDASIYPVGDSNVQVINLEESSADVKAQYTVPATSLTFADGSTSKNITMSTGARYSLNSQYNIAPAETTENVTWAVSNEKYSSGNAVVSAGDVGTVNTSTGLIRANELGTFTVTGTDESGHKIIANIMVYQAIESVELFCGSSNPSTYSVAYTSDNNTQWIGFRTTPARAFNWANTVWKSSNLSVATVQKDDNSPEYALLTYLSPGVTTITATIDDNGTIWTKSFELTVTKDFSSCTVSSIANQTYSASSITPSIKVFDGAKELKEGTDYILSYQNNVNAGQATVTATATPGSGYEGSINKYFYIRKAEYDLSHVSWTMTNFSYTGRNQSVTLTGLPEGVTASYSNNIKSAPGTYTATATLSYDAFNHNRPKTIKYSTSWNIAAQEQKITFKNKNVSNNTIVVPYGTKSFKLGGKAKTAVSYSGGYRKVATVDKSGKVTIKGTGYTTIKVKAKGAGNYKNSSTTLSIYVTPQKENINYIKSNKKSTLSVRWNKDTNVSGYQIQYSRSKTFSDNTTTLVNINKNTTTEKKINKLTKGKRYYVRVRSYKKVNVNGNSLKVYGNWCKVKNTTVLRK